MFRTYFSLHEQLTSWGKTQHRLPVHTEHIRHTVLHADVSFPRQSKKKQFVKWLGFGLATPVVGLLCIFLFMFWLDNSFPEVTYVHPHGGYQALMEVAKPAGLGTSGSDTFGVALGGPDAGVKTFRSKIVGLLEHNNSIGDTREFLKTDYDVRIHTRQVERMFEKLQVIIRGLGGRIDSTEVGTKYGKIRFVMPKSSMDNFEKEIHDMFRPKFLEEFISTTNKLPEKQKLEKDSADVTARIQNLEAQRQEITDTHNAHVADVQRQITIYANRIYVLKRETTTSTARQAEIHSQLTYAQNQYYSYQQQLKQENTTFSRAVQDIDLQIQSENINTMALQKQQDNLIEDVETVDGTISLDWISIMDILNLYVPIYWILWVGGGIMLFIYVRYGRTRRFKEI